MRMTERHRLWFALVIVIGVACVGSVGTALATETGPSQQNAMSVSSDASTPTDVTASGTMRPNVADVATIMALDGHEYPPVVARVNGAAISGKILAQRVYAVNHAGSGAPKVADPVKTALDALIQDMILRQAAKARGITVSDAEVRAFEQQQQTTLAQSPEGMSYMQQIVALEGYDSVAAYWANPRTIANIRDILLLGKMKQQIEKMLVKTLLTPQPNQPETTQQAIEQFVAAQRAHVKIYINP